MQDSENQDTERRRQVDRELFDRIARKYSKKDHEPYSRAARRHRVQSSVARLPPLGNVLEIGCGAGFSAEYLAGRYDRYLGLDYSAELIAVARECHAADPAGSAQVRFECADVEQFATDERFDTILMIGVLHHIPEPSAALARLSGWLAPGGRIVVNEPQRGNPLISAARNVRKKVDAHYSEDQVEFSREELLQLFEHAGYHVDWFPQGVLSTPFAETAFPIGKLGLAASQLACRWDPALESLLSRLHIEQLAWNLVVQAWPRQ
jgi:2-polyprenyl-3-methyl-5-hydroxy-6-metoxy-1,4-benzoquinol methylase